MDSVLIRRLIPLLVWILVVEARSLVYSKNPEYGGPSSVSSWDKRAAAIVLADNNEPNVRSNDLNDGYDEYPVISVPSYMRDIFIGVTHYWIDKLWAISGHVQDLSVN